MERLSFTDMIVPRSKIIADQQAQAQGQYALGDRLSKSVGGLVDAQNKNKQNEKEAKAQELQAQINSEWNDANGLFKGLANDSDKARKASALLAPWNRDLSQKWLEIANDFKQKEEAQNLSREKLKSEEDYNLKKLDQEGATKERELALKQSELDAKGEAPVKIEAQDYKNAMSAFSGGTYPQYYMQATANGTNNLANILPSPNLDQSKIEASLTAGSSGDLVKARTIAEQTQGTIAGEKKKGVELQSATLGLSADKLEKERADKDLTYERSAGLGALPPEVRSNLQPIVNEYQKGAGIINARKSQLDMLSRLISEKPVNAFNAIGAIITFNKILDPNSVVRETEFAIADGANGMADALQKKALGFVDCQLVTDAGVKALNDFAKKMQGFITNAESTLDGWAIKQAQRLGGGVQLEDIAGGVAIRKPSAVKTTTQAPSASVKTDSTEQAGIVDMGDGIEAFGE